MNTQVSILYTYRSPWPRRIAAGCAILLMLAVGVAAYETLQPEGAKTVAQSTRTDDR